MYFYLSFLKNWKLEIITFFLKIADLYYYINIKLLKIPLKNMTYLMAERMGFEPMKRFLLYTLSKRAPSTTRPPLHTQKKFTKF